MWTAQLYKPSKHQSYPLEALRDCVRQGIPVVFATGKHRGPWVEKLLSEALGT